MDNENYRELALIDFINIIFKNKITICLFLIVGMLITSVYLFYSQKKVVEAVIEIGGTSKGPVESTVQLKNKINMGYFGNYTGLSASDYFETNLIKIEISSKNQDESLRELKLVIESILSELNKEVDNMTEAIKDKNSQVLMADGMGVVIKTKIIKEPNAVPSGSILNFIVKTIIGGIAGLIFGLAFVLCRDWYKRASTARK